MLLDDATLPDDVPVLAAEDMRRLLAAQDPSARKQLRSSLEALPVTARDGWLDSVFGVDAFVPDDASLPRDCVPYIPCTVDVILRAIDAVAITDRDVVVDMGSGVGRAAALIHLLTGAGVVGLEIQPSLVERASALAKNLGTPRLRSVEGDAAELVRFIGIGTVFFLYCPFSGTRLERAIDALEEIASARPIRVCCVHLPRIHRPWLELTTPEDGELLIYRSLAPG